MEHGEMIKKLNSLIRLDIDAVHAYEQAMENIGEIRIRDRIAAFRNDHHRHFRELSDYVKAMKGEPPEYSPDFKDFFIQGFKALRRASGTEGALNAMEMNERLTNKNYEEATHWDLTPDGVTMVQKNSEDEKRHLGYVQTALKNRIWEAREGVPEERPEARL